MATSSPLSYPDLYLEMVRTATLRRGERMGAGLADGVPQRIECPQPACSWATHRQMEVRT